MNCFALSAYLPDQGHEADHPLTTALDDLGQTIECRQTEDVLVAGMDANMQLGTSAKYEGDGNEGVKAKSVGPHCLIRV